MTRYEMGLKVLQENPVVGALALEVYRAGSNAPAVLERISQEHGEDGARVKDQVQSALVVVAARPDFFGVA